MSTVESPQKHSIERCVCVCVCVLDKDVKMWQGVESP